MKNLPLWFVKKKRTYNVMYMYNDFSIFMVDVWRYELDLPKKSCCQVYHPLYLDPHGDREEYLPKKS